MRPTTIITAEPETTDTRPTIDPTSTKSDPTSTTATTFQSPVSTTRSIQDPPSTETEESTPTASSEPSPNATPGETSSDSSEGGSLDSGAVIGVSVASGLAGFFIIGVVISLCCRRIRRKNAQDREFFEIGGHMEEPPDFGFPPRRLPLGPSPSPGTLNADSESARLFPPPEQRQHPAVIITEPKNTEDRGHTTPGNSSGAELQSSSNVDFDAESTVSSRTVSDLLPDKPTYELYPRPLRWSQQKKVRLSSGPTPYEGLNQYGQRNLPSPSLQHFVFPSSIGGGNSRLPMAGLPANPRAMLYGFGRSQSQMPAIKEPEHGKKPVYANVKEKIQPSRQAAIRGASPHRPGHTDGFDNYWQSSDAGFVGARVIQPHGAARDSFHGVGMNRNSFGDYPGCESDSSDGSGTPSLESRRASRHSGNFRPLTPVREIRTPTGEAQTQKSTGRGPSNNGGKPRGYLPGMPPDRPTQPQEIVSRPRIVRQDDIKRVQIRRGKPSPKGVAVPYCPDDYWLEQMNECPSRQSAPRHLGDYGYTPGGMMGRMPKKKPLPHERNLTPSRRGAEMILQVD